MTLWVQWSNGQFVMSWLFQYNGVMRETASSQSKIQTHPADVSQELCLTHSLPWEFICHSCNYRPLCAQCVSEPPYHASHTATSLERSRSGLVGKCEEWRIRLTSKSDLMEVVHDQLSSSKAEANSSGQDYCQAINEWVDETVKLLKDKAKQLTGAVEASTQQYLRITSQHMQNIRARRQHIQQLMGPLQRRQLEATPTPRIAQLLSLQQAQFNQLLDETQLEHYKKQLLAPQFTINPQSIAQLRQSIHDIKLTSPKKHAPPASAIYQPTISKKKSKKTLKVMDATVGPNNIESAVVTPFVAISTPKNQSRQKVSKLARSPESVVGKKRGKSNAKMVSMPASPAKECEKGGVLVHDLSRKRLFKKK